MKNRKVRFSKCKPENKTAFPDEKSALRAITLIWGSDSSVSFAEMRDDLHVYPCPHAGHFHVGHRSYYKMLLEKNASLPDLRSSVLPN